MVHQSTTIVVNKSDAMVHDCAHYAEMSVTDDLRRHLREAHVKSGKGVLAFEHQLGFSKSALKAVISDQYNQVPSLDKAERIAEALGLELYLGPPRSTDPNSSSSNPLHIGPADAHNYRTAASDAGLVGVGVEIGPLGTAEFSLTPEQAKDLASRLIHQAMVVEEREQESTQATRRKGE